MTAGASGARWARSGADPPHTLSDYQESIPIELIATPRRDFRICRRDDRVCGLVDRYSYDQIDHLPVMDGQSGPDGSIVGVFPVAELARSGGAEGSVGERMEPLREEHLIGADASILSFVRGAEARPFRLVISGPEIIGLVSISDLQRLPVRAALFALVTLLELVMAEAIQRRLPDSDAWMELLSEGRRGKVHEQEERGRGSDTLVDRVLYTQFCDKVTIIAKMDGPRNWSLEPFDCDMRGAQDLRDELAHANEYAASLDAARKVCQLVRAMDPWIHTLTEWALA